MDFDGILFFPVTPFDADGRVDDDLLREHIATPSPTRPGGVFPACGTGRVPRAVGGRGGDGRARRRRRRRRPRARRRRRRRPARARDRASRAARPTPAPTALLVLPPYLVAGPQPRTRRLRRGGRRGIRPARRDLPPRHRAVLRSTPCAGSPRTRRSSASRTASATSASPSRSCRAVAETGRDDFAFFNGLLTAELTQGAYRGIGIPLYSSAAFAMAPEIANAYYRAYVDGDEAAPRRAARRVLRAAGAPARRDARASASRSSRPACGCGGLAVGGVRPPLVDPTPEQEERLAGDPRGRTRTRCDAPIDGVRRDELDPACRSPGRARADCHVGRRASRRTSCDSDGAEGWGFSWTPQIGAEAVHALLEHDIARVRHRARRRPRGALGAAVAAPARGGRRRDHDDRARRARPCAVGCRGPRAPARSIVDAARPAARAAVRAYGSGVNLHYPLEELVAQAERWVDAGFDAVKIKVGKPDLAEDVERVAAVREVLGPRPRLMIDANQRWDLETRDARRSTRSAAVRPAWIEEPLRADDLAGHAELARRIDVPIAVGENLHTALPLRGVPATRAPRRSCSRTSCASAASRRSGAIADLAAEHGVDAAPAPAARALGAARADAPRARRTALGRRRRGRRLRRARRARATVSPSHRRRHRLHRRGPHLGLGHPLPARPARHRRRTRTSTR